MMWCLLGGLISFVPVFIEVFFIMSSIWLHHYTYMFGFLLVVFLILTITCAEVSIVLCYFQLCSEDYHWWWRSFFTSGSSALYMFLYSAFYFCYMAILSYGFFLLTGTMGFIATFLFVRAIY